MFSLTHSPKSSFVFRGLEFNVDLSFDNILRMFDLFQDDMFGAYEKIIVALEMLVLEYDFLENLTFEEHFYIYEFIMKEFLGIELGKKESDSSSKKVMDWSKDAGLIYASFLSEYKMDLHEQMGKLHWETFSILLANLGDKTAFKQVVSYRTMKIPSTKEASEDYRNHVKKMKQLYSLEEPRDNLENLEHTLDTVASTFSKGGGKK